MDFFNKMGLTVVVQLVTLYQIGWQLSLPTLMTEILTLIPGKVTYFSRMFLSLFLHLSILGDCQNSLVRMKYAMNHPYMFETPFLAFATALI